MPLLLVNLNLARDAQSDTVATRKQEEEEEALNQASGLS